jgi:hypothetical protein
LEFRKMTQGIQFSTADHVTQDENVAMSTDSQENARHCKEGEHLLSCLWASIFPSLNTGVHALRKIIELIDIKPSDILPIKICVRQIYIQSARIILIGWWWQLWRRRL